MGRLDGRVALITGAGREQGRSHAVRLAEEGANIVAIDIGKDIDGVSSALSTPEDLAETVRLVEALERRVVSFEADVRDMRALTEAVEQGMEQLGRLDIVAADVGVASGPTRA